MGLVCFNGFSTAQPCRTAEYNKAVNAYGTETAQFPGNLFAGLFGFPDYDYYRPDKKALTFEGVKY